LQLAITRQVSRSIEQCELTHMTRAPIDLIRARQQHAWYEQALRDAGLAVLSLPEEPDMPDSVFVEDTALVLDECAIGLRPGADSRLPEADSICDLLRHFRKLHRIQPPARIDGGDILRLGRRVYVGVGQRTDEAAVDQIRSWVTPFGYSVDAVRVSGCLHLKSAATEVAPGAVLVNPEWVDPGVFQDVKSIEIDPSESYAANAVRIGATVLFPEAFPLTRSRLERRGLATCVVAADELAKAEGALTCCSLIFNA
jgi:dimethylargininase